MRNKLVRIWIPLFLVVSMLAYGCGKKDTADTYDSSAGSVSGKGMIEKDSGIEPSNNAIRESEKKDMKKTEMKGTVSVSSFFENEYLNTAAKGFMKKYPKVKVVINEYGKDIERPSEKDYQTLIGTKLMSGEAEDIIMNSFLPVEKYSNMGAFEDLSKYISETSEMNDKNYFMNILSAAKRETGEIYLLPYNVSFQALCFDGKLLEEQPNVQNSLKNNEKLGFGEGMKIAYELVKNTKKSNAYLSVLSPVIYMDYLIKDRLDEFIDIRKKEVHIKGSEYVNLLDSVKKLREDNLFSPDNIDFYNTKPVIAGTVDYDIQAAFYAMEKQADSSYNLPLADSNGKVMLNANVCLMMNSKSEHKALAWEFIKYLLSDEAQSVPAMTTIPVNRRGFEKAVRREYDYYTENNAGVGSVKEYKDILSKWIENINGCDTLDVSLVSMMEEENEKFFEGKQTAEKTAEILQRKAEQYFYE